MIVSAGDLVRSALMEIRVARAEQAPSYSEVARGLELLTEIVDQWNARTRAIYVTTELPLPLTGGVARYTLGLATTVPPVTVALPVGPPPSLAWAVRVQTGGLRVSLGVHHTAAWYAGIEQPGLAGLPSDVYYALEWPVGAVYVWPVPTVAEVLGLGVARLAAGPLIPATTLDLPYGYAAALRLTLAEWCAESFGQKASPATAGRARAARAVVFNANDRIVDGHTRDAGMPGGPRGAGYDNRQVTELD